MYDGKEYKKVDWRVGLVPAIACGVFVYVVEQMLHRTDSEETVDVVAAMYDLGAKVVSRITDSRRMGPY